MKVDIDDIFKPNFTYNDFIFSTDLEIIGDHIFSVAVPSEYPVELKKYIMTAIKSFTSGNTLNYTYNRYSESWDFNKQNTNELVDFNNKVISEITIIYKNIIEKREKIDNLKDIFGLVAAGAALLRLESSFKLSCCLLKLGYHFDGIALVKLILEQISWSYSVFKIEDQTLYKIQPSKTLTKLNSLIPWAGKLYGELNKIAHIHTSQINKIVNFDAKKISVYLSNVKHSISSSFLLFHVLDAYGIVMEYIYKDYISERDFLNKDLSIKKNRKTYKLIIKYAKEAGEIFTKY